MLDLTVSTRKRACDRLEQVGGAGGQQFVKTSSASSVLSPRKALHRSAEGRKVVLSGGGEGIHVCGRYGKPLELVPVRARLSAHTPEPILVFTSLHSAPTSAYSCTNLQQTRPLSWSILLTIGWPVADEPALLFPARFQQPRMPIRALKFALPSPRSCLFAGACHFPR